MQPGVPFALLGAVQLLAVCAWLAVAATGVVLGRARPVAVGLLGVGAVTLATADALTGLRFGVATADDLAVARAAGGLLLAAGVATGGFGAVRRRSAGVDGATGAGLGGVVVPLAATPTFAVAAGVAAALAGAMFLRAGRSTGRLLVAAGVVLAGVATAVGSGAGSSPGVAALVLAVRGLGALVLLTGLLVLARVSLLAKVVAAILAGVLAMAAAAVGVVGTVVVRAYDQQAASLVQQAAQGRLQALDDVGNRAAALAPLVAAICTGPQQRTLCNLTLDRLAPGAKDFVAEVTDRGVVTSLGGRAPLGPTERLGLVDPHGPVQLVLLSTGAAAISSLPTRVELAGSPPGLAVVAVQVPQGARPRPQGAASRVLVYGVRVDDDYTRNDFDAGGYGLSFLAGDPLEVVASNLSDSERSRLLALAGQHQVGQALPTSGLTVPAVGTDPTVYFVPLAGAGDVPVGVLALSRDATTSLAAQRDALRVLLLTALATTVLVGGLAIWLGRRTVEPVRRLTAAAQQVSRGDLLATADVRSADEVGTLSRAFDTMTSSLASLTGDLRAAADRLETVLASMSDGLVATNEVGRVSSINPAALEMLGLASAQEALGRPLAEAVVVADARGEPMPLSRSARLDEVPGVVWRATGLPVPVRVSLGPLESGTGDILVLRDTTREREVERMKTEFLANVSHELRTPLTPIRGYAEILVSRRNLTDAMRQDFATRIRDDSLRMERVVDLLVDVAALEAGRVSMSPREVSARSVLEDRLAAWKERAPDRAGELQRRVGRALPSLLVDPEWLAKALDELVDNAVKHSEPGTAVVLSATAAPDPTRVRLSVRDHGTGITAEAAPRLFTAFEQVDGSATRSIGGLGLGLAFVRRLADEAGFVLSVRSEVGHGSEFSLDVTAGRAETEQVAARRAGRPNRRAAKAR